LEQVLLNIGSNAVKFTDQGRVDLKVLPVTQDALSVRLRFEVRDTGIGIDKDALGRLFQPFVQADASINRRFGGTGLGLVISQRLLALMHGELHVSSEPGQGSVFWFELSFDRATPVAEGPVLSETGPGDRVPRLTGLRVLAVDDSQINRMLIERALQREGAHVTLASDGQQALEILKAQARDFDAVLMDIQMPIMDGMSATRAIRSDPELAHLPVFALSAGVLAEEREAALDAGVNDFLGKPLNLDQLNQLLEPFRPSFPRS
jgi:CheY-like chemotaxis protein